MANITKRANKRCAQYLDGEVAEIALLCEMKGGLGGGAIGSVLAARTTNRIMEKRTDQRLEDEGGIAAQFPSSTSAVLLTHTRFIALPSNGLKFGEPTLAVPRSEVTAELAGRKGLGKRLAFVFADGTRAEVDVGAGQPLDQLVAALT